MKSFNPERDLFASSQENLPEAEEALFDILVPENEKRAIVMNDFEDLYGSKVIEKDTAYVKDLETKFNKSETRSSSLKAGKLFEAIVNFGIGEYDYMGPNAKSIVPSRYDDIANGIDSIIRFKGEKETTSHIALGIDVTKSRSELQTKLARVKNSIDDGTLPRVKYFKSGNFREKMKPVIRVIVGADQVITEDISNRILRSIRMKKTIAENRAKNDESDSANELPKKFAENRKALAEHPLQWVILFEMKEQLEAFGTYAESVNQIHIVKECAKILHIVEEIIKEKELSGQKVDKHVLAQDKVFNLLRENLAVFHERISA